MPAKLTTLGSVTVTTSGTRKQITTTPTPCYGICVQAPASNSGKIYIGDSTVTTSNGHEIAAGQYFILNPVGLKGFETFMLDDYWLDAAVSGEGARVSYIKQRPS